MGNELTQLRRARAEAQWSQTQLIAAMRRAAPSLKIRLPDNESLKTNVTRWENGHVMPGPDYRKLLRVVYGSTRPINSTSQPATRVARRGVTCLLWHSGSTSFSAGYSRTPDAMQPRWHRLTAHATWQPNSATRYGTRIS